MRVALNGERTEFSIQRKIDPVLWNQDKEIAIGQDKESSEINMYILSLRARIYKIQRELEDDSKYYNIQSIREQLVESPKMFFELFKENNERYEKFAGITITSTTWKRYVRCLEYFKEMYIPKYKKEDFPISELTPSLIDDFEIFLRTKKKCEHNTTNKYLKYVKKICNHAIENGWLKKNPFTGRKLSEVDVYIEFLTIEEVNTIRNKKIEVERLAQVRDVFIFCCYTGLAFIDVTNLKEEHITKDNAGNLWIRNKRKKTGIRFDVPLLDVPLQLLEKYKNNPLCIQKGTLLPVISNQHFNVYLKEIATICGIKKRLTTHIGRHTFATSITLANKVSIENVQKMLGHSDISMTQHYAKVLDHSILKDMNMVNSQLNQG